jgi:hypothetical protein
MHVTEGQPPRPCLTKLRLDSQGVAPVFVLLFAAFRILRNDLLLKTSSKERRAEKRGPIMRRKAVLIGAHHRFLAARAHFRLVGSNGGTDIGLRSNTPLFQFLAKSGCIMNGVVEALATILQRNLLAAFQNSEKWTIAGTLGADGY